jgi:hypothetical protein
VALPLYEQAELLTMMSNNVEIRSLHYVLLAVVILLASESYAGEKASVPHVCDHVAIDSVKGDVGIWRNKILGFSRALGLTGPIIYVDVIVPSQADSPEKIRRISLWWGAHLLPTAVCKAGPDIGQKPAINCAESIPGTQLQLDITFEPEGTRDPEMRTNELVKYVSDDVLCKLD